MTICCLPIPSCWPPARTRRVKCDERKPTCLRCVNFGVTCDGYKDIKKQSRKLEDIITRARPLVAKQNVALIPNSSTARFKNGQEHLYFELFCSKTSFEILPTFNSGALRQMLLQACESNSSIRYAVIALGALDRTSERSEDFKVLSFENGNRKEEVTQHHQQALEQYSRAIEVMRKTASTGRQDIRTTLLTCLVIMCFEAWHGNHLLALQQIKTGLRLIEGWKENYTTNSSLHPHGTSSPAPNIIEDDLVQIFGQLSDQQASFADDRPREVHLALSKQGKELVLQMPPIFTSLQEARFFRALINTRAVHFIAGVPISQFRYPDREYPVDGVWEDTSHQILLEQRNHARDFERWFQAFEPLSQNIDREDDKSMVDSLCLQLHMKSSYMALSTTLAADELAYDDRLSDFISIIQLSSSIIHYLRRLHNSKIPKFSFELLFILPLYLTGHKCRSLPIRQKAVELLLAWPRREGVWDSIFAGKVTQWAMEVEEEFRDERGFVPGWARIRGIGWSHDDLVSRRAVLFCQQRVSADSDEMRVRVKSISWWDMYMCACV